MQVPVTDALAPIILHCRSLDVQIPEAHLASENSQAAPSGKVSVMGHTGLFPEHFVSSSQLVSFCLHICDDATKLQFKQQGPFSEEHCAPGFKVQLELQQESVAHLEPQSHSSPCSNIPFPQTAPETTVFDPGLARHVPKTDILEQISFWEQSEKLFKESPPLCGFIINWPLQLHPEHVQHGH